MQLNTTTKIAPVKAKLTVTKAAQLLGVTRVHLSYVIHGHRRSPRLLFRYSLLQHTHRKLAA